MNEKIFVIGGDLRLSYASSELLRRGFDVSYAGCPDNDGRAQWSNAAMPQDADILLFGIPMSADGVHLNAPFCDKSIVLADIAARTSPDALVIGGKIPPGIFTCETADYALRDDFAMLNAVPTAEGVLEIAMRETDITISGCRCLVTGFGRIGKLICAAFHSLGANVCASARKPGDIAYAKALGYDAVYTADIANTVHEYDIIVNTIPHTVLGREVLRHVEHSTLIIDTASKPGGVDICAAQALGLNVIWALSLPGKVAPRTCGKIICDTVLNILNETNRK